MMYEFDDWLNECYHNGDIALEELKDAELSLTMKMDLWEAYQSSFMRSEKYDIVTEALAKLLKKAGQTPQAQTSS